VVRAVAVQAGTTAARSVAREVRVLMWISPTLGTVASGRISARRPVSAAHRKCRIGSPHCAPPSQWLSIDLIAASSAAWSLVIVAAKCRARMLSPLLASTSARAIELV